MGLTLVHVSCASDSSDTPFTPSDPLGDTLIVLPDTQFYTCAFADVFEQQTRWIADVRAQRHISLVLHTGDIVDSDLDPQWRVALESMSELAGEVPYLVTTGNHDLRAGRASLIQSYFPTSLLFSFDFESDTYEGGRIDNTYAIVRLAGREWLVLGLEFGPRNRVVEWADHILSAHPELPAIVFTHAYLFSDGQRYDRAYAPLQPFHPDLYQLTPEQGINDGQDLWTKLVSKHDNVRLVLSGHVIPDGTAHSSVTRASGSVVHQVLANYQLCDACPCAQVEGGGGFLRILTFSADAIRIETYSPYSQEWLRDPDNEFVLSPLL
ncbi:MAG: metallophosphoesterase [Polyangiales bacterium]